MSKEKGNDTILIVDDDVLLLSVIETALLSFGYYVDVAQSGADALVNLKSAKYDLMITDIRMPGMNGIELSVKARSLQSDLAIIFISADTVIGDSVEAVIGDKMGWLRKPYSNSLLRDMVNKILKKSKSVRETADDSEQFLEKLKRMADTFFPFDQNNSAVWITKGTMLIKLIAHDKTHFSSYRKKTLDQDKKTNWFKKGKKLAKLGRYEEALAAYDTLIAIDPNNTSAWINKGMALGKLGRHEEAKKAFSKAKKFL